eukprot:CAMPEP_0202452314 /NCGR_PEP_ID=MMETSP1360-20130828/10554_1 /ASSEMBLY_ACC=CAM_ASM_000848 /TAXON_ID=515479 /ORGANISM="Licmophora paradoxa, Strain CCMP2313" /LENGTH=242 /DNA_ID=CAMNT_0049071101 /DNA_START=226 /DNA_END=951 /DNA_ORIENTATION=+
MDVLIPHCIAVKKRVESTVTTEAHLGPSLYKVFPRTIEGPLPSVWQTIVDERGVGVQHQTEENFDEDIKSFIQEHCPEQCRYQLVQQLRAFKKPRDLPVLDFSYRLQELNSWVEWMPGNEEPLNPTQLKQAFYNAMPSTWKERYSDSGTRLSTESYKNVVHYFRDQEHRANSRQRENEVKQSRASKGSGRRFSQRGTPKTKNPRRQTALKETDQNKKTSKRISDDTACPIHPDASHTWGECF